MSNSTCLGKEPCSACGSIQWSEAHWTGRLICLPCWREIERGKAKVPAKQQALRFDELVKPRVACVRTPEPDVWGDHVQADFGVLDGGIDV